MYIYFLLTIHNNYQMTHSPANQEKHDLIVMNIPIFKIQPNKEAIYLEYTSYTTWIVHT